MMRLLISVTAALVLTVATATGAEAATFDRVCATHAEGAEPDDVALPDPGAPVVVRLAKRDRPYVAFDFSTEGHSGNDRVAEDGQSSVRFHPCPRARSASATASRSASGPATRVR